MHIHYMYNIRMYSRSKTYQIRHIPQVKNVLEILHIYSRSGIWIRPDKRSRSGNTAFQVIQQVRHIQKVTHLWQAKTIISTIQYSRASIYILIFSQACTLYCTLYSSKSDMYIVQYNRSGNTAF